MGTREVREGSNGAVVDGQSGTGQGGDVTEKEVTFDVICPHCKRSGRLPLDVLKSLWGRYTNSMRKIRRGGGLPKEKKGTM